MGFDAVRIVQSRWMRRLAPLTALVMVVVLAPLPRMEFLQASVGATVALPAVEPVPAEDLAEVQAAADEPLGEDRVAARDDAVERFTLMAVVFDTPPQAPVMVRVQSADGEWGEWRELHVALDEGPDQPTNYGTEPFWVGDAEAYEVNLTDVDAADAEVVLVHEELRRSVAVSEPVAGAAAAPFGVGTRASWGARAVAAPSYGSTIKMGVVHHSVSGNSYSPAEVPGVLRGIQAYHIDGRGWSDIGYNFAVDRFGGVWEARGGGIDQPVVGAHASGFNTNTVGVVVLGDYTSVGPSGEALEGVSKVIGWKMSLHGTDPAGSGTFVSGGSPRYAAGVSVNLPNVVGHTDVGSTGCPGSVWNHLGWIRNRAQEWKSWIQVFSGATGNLETVEGGTGVVGVSGWAADPSSPSAVTVLATAGHVTRGTSTTLSRPDVTAAHPGYYVKPGFSLVLDGVHPGLQLTCVTALDNDGGSNAGLGCRKVLVGDPSGTSPYGRIAGTETATGGFRILGWSVDPDAPGSRTVMIRVDGVEVGRLPSRPDGTFDFRARGIHGGRREVCFALANRGQGWDVEADCRYLDIGGAAPTGTIESFVLSGRSAQVAGWAYDPESTGPVRVDIVYDRGAHVWPARTGLLRPDVEASYGHGGAGGYELEIYGIPNGEHTVCAVARNVGAGSDSLLGCRTFVVK